MILATVMSQPSYKPLHSNKGVCNAYVHKQTFERSSAVTYARMYSGR
jgi:hypothetical protein